MDKRKRGRDSRAGCGERRGKHRRSFPTNSKQITARLLPENPRKISEADAQQLISTGKPFYWASGSIHSPESGSPEMLMELAYRLAVEDTPMIQNIRKNMVFLITPIVEVDGHDRMVDWTNYRKAYPTRPQPDLVYWGHYVQHDNNRDSIGMGLKLSQVMMKNFLAGGIRRCFYDLHESEPYLYASLPAPAPTTRGSTPSL